jgi:hypothetical protein
LSGPTLVDSGAGELEEYTEIEVFVVFIADQH